MVSISKETQKKIRAFGPMHFYRPLRAATAQQRGFKLWCWCSCLDRAPAGGGQGKGHGPITTLPAAREYWPRCSSVTSTVSPASRATGAAFTSSLSGCPVLPNLALAVSGVSAAAQDTALRLHIYIPDKKLDKQLRLCSSE
jgi:hypothetical protein